jgi:hypothetical protein
MSPLLKGGLMLLAVATGAAARDCEGQPVIVPEDRRTSASATLVATWDDYDPVRVHRVCDDGRLLYVASRRDTRGGVSVVYAGACEALGSEPAR